MEIGIGLPNAVPGTSGDQLTDWARAADEAGFSTLGTIDRIVYPSYESIVALSGAAAVTERIRLTTSVLLGPLRLNAALLAKQVLSLDALAGGGRTVLGIGIGAREDDYEVSGVSMSERGAWMDSALATIRRIWDGEDEDEAKIGPRPIGDGPSLIVGGGVDAVFDRAARYAHGWILGGGGPDVFSGALETLNAAWERHGREGEPRKMALAYFSLGDDAQANAERYALKYYAFLGDEIAEMLAGSVAKNAEAVQEYVSGFEAAGCDELIIFPSSADTGQVTLLAEAAGL